MQSNPKKPDWYPELINYLANPYDNRTYDEFAEKVGVDRSWLWNIRKVFKNEIAADVAKERQQAIESMRVQAWKALASKLKSDTNALKLFYQLSGDLVERVEQTNKFESPEQKREKLADAFAKLGFTLSVAQPHISPVIPPNNQDNSNQIKH